MALVTRVKTSTPVRRKQELYSDFFTDLLSLDVTRDIAKAMNEDAVKQSIRNLLLTNRGDRLFNNTLGSDIYSLLFENSSPALEQTLSDYIKTTIENYEPRAELIDVVVDSEADEHEVLVVINFRVLNKTEPVSLELVLNRIR
jgi:phage baseplate assembly protein W